MEMDDYSVRDTCSYRTYKFDCLEKIIQAILIPSLGLRYAAEIMKTISVAYL